MEKVYIKALNACNMRKSKIVQYGEYLTNSGYTCLNSIEKANVIIVWTCAFRKDMLDNSLEQISNIKEVYPNKRVIIAGCLPDIAPNAVLNYCTEDDILPWKDDSKLSIILPASPRASDIILDLFRTPCWGEKNICSDLVEFRKNNPGVNVTFHDQFIKLLISEGCNSKCTYCTERLAFPKYRSFTIKELLNKARSLMAETECRDIILIADSLGEYGSDIGSSLMELISELCDIGENVTCSLNNFNPRDAIKFNAQIIPFLQKGSIKHINLPIQSASNKILKLMNREYSQEELRVLIEGYKKIGFYNWDTHVICGFPCETDEAFHETVQFLLDCSPKYVLASGYLEVEKSFSKDLQPKVLPEVKRQRLKEIERVLTENGIICNIDEGELAKIRLRTLNHSEVGISHD